MSKQTKPCVDGLFSDADGAAILHGSKCRGCDTPYFPKSGLCHNPHCDDSIMEDCDFSGKGVLWSYSVANFPPAPPAKFDLPFKPYVMGVVDMENGLRLIAQMTNAQEDVRIDADVELVIDTLYHEDDIAYTTWKFKQL